MLHPRRSKKGSILFDLLCCPPAFIQLFGRCVAGLSAHAQLMAPVSLAHIHLE